MTERCEPPAGTPPGTVCILTNGSDLPWKWSGAGWYWHGDERTAIPAESSYRHGWRFVRVVENGNG